MLSRLCVLPPEVRKNPTAYGMPSNFASEQDLEQLLKEKLILKAIQELAAHGLVSGAPLCLPTRLALIVADLRVPLHNHAFQSIDWEMLQGCKCMHDVVMLTLDRQWKACTSR
jgi:hypothetical protein